MLFLFFNIALNLKVHSTRPIKLSLLNPSWRAIIDTILLPISFSPWLILVLILVFYRQYHINMIVMTGFKALFLKILTINAVLSDITPPSPYLFSFTPLQLSGTD